MGPATPEGPLTPLLPEEPETPVGPLTPVAGGLAVVTTRAELVTVVPVASVTLTTRECELTVDCVVSHTKLACRPRLLVQHPGPAGRDPLSPSPPVDIVRPVLNAAPPSLTHHVSVCESPSPKCDTTASRDTVPDKVELNWLRHATVGPVPDDTPYPSSSLASPSPVAPVTPVGPEAPVDPDVPVDPDTPVDPDAPVDPVDPAGPVIPATPVEIRPDGGPEGSIKNGGVTVKPPARAALNTRWVEVALAVGAPKGNTVARAMTLADAPAVMVSCLIVRVSIVPSRRRRPTVEYVHCAWRARPEGGAWPRFEIVVRKLWSREPHRRRVMGAHRRVPLSAHGVFPMSRARVRGVAYGDTMAFDQPLPTSLSPSRLADFQSCPRRYQYASVERISQPATYATAKGRLVHYVFEQLFKLAPPERTVVAAREFVSAASAHVLTTDVRTEIGLDDARETQLLAETDAIIETYFAMEDPRAIVSEGVELRVKVTVDDTPLLGILDRLDRDEEGNLVIVDYKTGSVPNRNFDSYTFANAELYAVLCEAKLHERPTKIRLLYVSQGQSIERSVSDAVLRARTVAATSAWRQIKEFYDHGDFPTSPSKNACRFCAFTDRCPDAWASTPR